MQRYDYRQLEWDSNVVLRENPSVVFLVYWQTSAGASTVVTAAEVKRQHLKLLGALSRMQISFYRCGLAASLSSVILDDI